MPSTAYLVLDDGSIYEGTSFGSESSGFGELVFSTSMTGYQEMLTDPSYAGQLLVATYPMIGNYGINQQDFESAKIQVSGMAVHQAWESPSHYDTDRTLGAFLSSQNIPGISGIDTRSVTRKIRAHGVMMAAITTSETPKEALKRLRKSPAYGAVDHVKQVTTKESYVCGIDRPASPRITVIDCGVKYNILRLLINRGCKVHVVPSTATIKEVLATKPMGVVFSPGPGDPAHNTATVTTAQAIIGNLPILGICLGQQLIARALGAETYKLKFGHRGGNHPVQELESGRVYITAQNHGYAVSEENLPQDLIVTHRNLNDGTIEGLRHRDAPIITIQYHSEASPGPQDNQYIFDRFLEMIDHRMETT